MALAIATNNAALRAAAAASSVNRDMETSMAIPQIPITIPDYGDACF